MASDDATLRPDCPDLNPRDGNQGSGSNGWDRVGHVDAEEVVAGVAYRADHEVTSGMTKIGQGSAVREIAEN